MKYKIIWVESLVGCLVLLGREDGYLGFGVWEIGIRGVKRWRGKNINVKWLCD